MSSQSFSYENKKYPFWTYGSNKNIPLLLIPGFTGTHSDLKEIIRFLEKKYFVIISDLPGWGNSPKGKSHLTITSYAHFLHTLIKSLNLPEKINVVGHCMGAVVALEYAHLFENSTKQIFIISDPYPNGDNGQEILIHLTDFTSDLPKKLRPLFYFWRSRLIAIPLGFLVIQTKSIKKKIKIIIGNTLKQSHQDEQTVETNWSSLVDFNYEKLRDLKIPVHVIHGEKDMLVKPMQAEKLSKIFSHSTLDIIKNSGHMPPVETPESLVKVIEKYL